MRSSALPDPLARFQVPTAVQSAAVVERAVVLVEPSLDVVAEEVDGERQHDRAVLLQRIARHYTLAYERHPQSLML